MQPAPGANRMGLGLRPPFPSFGQGPSMAALAAQNHPHPTFLPASSLRAIFSSSIPSAQRPTMSPAPNSQNAFKTILAGRKCYRMSKDKNEVVWPIHLEAALMEGALALCGTPRTWCLIARRRPSPRSREVHARRVQVAARPHPVPQPQQVHRRVHPQEDGRDPHGQTGRQSHPAAPRHQRGEAQ